MRTRLLPGIIAPAAEAVADHPLERPRVHAPLSAFKDDRLCRPLPRACAEHTAGDFRLVRVEREIVMCGRHLV